MVVDIVLEGSESLEQYAQVPIRFFVDRQLEVVWHGAGLSGISLTEEPVAVPYWYDYDEYESPLEWRQWDLSAWGFFAAYDGGRRVGGATIARATPDLSLLEGQPDLACLWDIRVAPEARRSGIGTLLFDAAATWAQAAGANWLKIETQNINVNACQFYASHGCRLEGVRSGVYEQDRDQVQLLWYRRLQSVARDLTT